MASNLTHEQRRIKELADRLEARLHTTQVIAEIVQDNAALREGTPGPYLNQYREGALMDALVHLSRASFDDFCSLADLVEVPR
jgi:hypothetical protein